MSEDNLAGWRDWGVTVLRIAVGVVFAAHGGQKLFMVGFANVAAFMGKVGIPFPMLAGVVVTCVEFLGGLALIVGLCTRGAALLLAIDMLVAILAVHLRGGFFLPAGVEFAFTLLAANLALVALGSGQVSLDGLRKARRT